MVRDIVDYCNADIAWDFLVLKPGVAISAVDEGHTQPQIAVGPRLGRFWSRAGSLFSVVTRKENSLAAIFGC